MGYEKKNRKKTIQSNTTTTTIANKRTANIAGKGLLNATRVDVSGLRTEFYDPD